MINRLLLIVFGTCCSLLTHAQSLQATFATYTSLDGLVHNNILDIYTDSKGFVWLCTWNGVSRFDGYHFKNYCNEPDNSPVLHNRFIEVEEDSNTHLWFKTYDGRIYRFNRFTEEFEALDGLVEPLLGRTWRVGHILFCNQTPNVWVEFQGYGLVCFKGERNEESLKPDSYIADSLIGPDITCLNEGTDGTIWVVCGADKIVTMSKERKKELRYTTHEPIIASCVMREGMAYATRHSVIYINQFTQHIINLHESGISTLASGTIPDELYVGMRNGVKVLKVTENGFVDMQRHFTGPSPCNVEKIVADTHNTLWITDARPGIIRLNLTDGNYKHFGQKLNTVDYFPDTLSVVQERNGIVWLKMKQAGFGYYNREKDRVEAFYNDAASSNYRMTNGITAFEIDPNNVIWLSPYYEKGLIKGVVTNSHQDAYHFEKIFSTTHVDDIRALLNDRSGNLWIGTKNGNLYCYDVNHKLVHVYSHADSGEPLGRIYAIYEDDSHRLWIGTKGNGLWRLTFDGHSPAFKHYLHDPGKRTSISDNNIYSITQDYQGRLWLATFEGGLNLLENLDGDSFLNCSNSFPNYPHGKNERVRYLLSDTPDRMFAATTEGLLFFNPSMSVDKMQFTVCQRYPGSRNSISSNDIIHILKDSSNRIWLSTYGGGVSMIKGYQDNDVPVFINYTTADGLPSNIILAATEDAEGNIWFSTEKGVVKWETQKEVFTDYTQWNYEEPVSYDEAASVTDAEGNIIFGGMNKLHVINPSEAQMVSYDYQLEFTGFEIQNQPYRNGKKDKNNFDDKGNELYLPYDYSHFRIEFASLNFRAQDKVNYMFQLDGFDNSWATAKGINSAYYSKVPPGRYVFRVKAYVGNAFMASPEQTLVIHIATPPWLSWYAYLLYTALTAFILWIIGKHFYTVTKLRTEAKMEQRLSDVKIRFFTNVSHELRTPLTLIMGGLEDLQHKEALSDRGKASLNMSYKNSKRMLMLINQLLDFRKIVKDKLELRVREANIIPLVRSTVQDFRDMADSKGISLLLTTSHEDIFLWIDCERIESVLYNLLSNAFKFTPKGGHISLSVIKSEDKVCISVTDSGAGIPKEQQELIFARFAQFQKFLNGKVYGSGIGLALCKEIIETHHGNITVESKVGKGSTFTVTLPLGKQNFQHNEHDTKVHETSPEMLPMNEEFTKKSQPDFAKPELPDDAPWILVVDDNAEIRKLISNSLQDSYHLMEADDGIDALEKLSQRAPDIIITDLLMPRMDGIVLVDKIRKDFETSHIPIIMLTAKQGSEDRLKALKYGADSYLTKPFSMELLLAYIDNLLVQRRLLFERFSSQSATHSISDFIPQQDLVVTNRDQEFMETLMAYIEENIQNSELTINDLAAHLNLGRTTMYNKVKSLTGKSPVELIREYRVTKAEMLMKKGECSVSELAYQLGFSDPSYFSRCFKERYKVSPKEYMRRYNSADKKDEN